MAAQNEARPTVGILGLGNMGGAYARHLCDAGWPVVGYDISAAALGFLSSLGGKPLATPAEVGQASDIILMALASEVAVNGVVDGPNGLGAVTGSTAILCEMGTFSVEFKTSVAERLSSSGITVIDCPVSGTGAQAAKRDIVVYASGDREAVEIARPVFDILARETRYVGPFGDGMKLKLVANLLVAVHNLAAAEALLLAQKSGLDLAMVFDAISSGAGTSRMFEVRGSLMLDGAYQPATMKHDIFIKDVDLILDQIRDAGSLAPLMEASKAQYLEALAQGRGDEDTASLFASLQQQAIVANSESEQA